MATELMAAAKATKGRTGAEWEEVPELLQAAQDTMLARGGASLGDKIMLDALAPIVSACRTTCYPKQMKGVAKKALAEFRDKPNKFGRACVYADKSIGLDNPGMKAVGRILDVL